MVLKSVNQLPVRDIIDWKKALAAPVLNLTLSTATGEDFSTRIRHRSGEDIGIVFCSPTVDDLRQCRNNCTFCFVRQMPRGQRQTLYVRDDDYRLSLVYGSFVTLTNVSGQEWQRILAEKISPIYVSVHTTNPDLRVEMMGNPDAGKIMTQLTELVSAGITVHAQLVLVPGVNDGSELVRSLNDLLVLYPFLESVAVVPVGLTEHRAGQPLLSGFDATSARDVLNIVQPLSSRLRTRLKTSFVYAADEFFVLARADFPPASYYDEFSQLENGVGLSRIFVDDFLAELRSHRKRQRCVRPVVWVTGESSYRLLSHLQHRINFQLGTHVDILCVQNELFGGRVTVTGLLGGQDILRALQAVSGQWGSGATVLIPDITLREEQFLDGMSLADIQSSLPSLNLTICASSGYELVRKTLYYGGEV